MQITPAQAYYVIDRLVREGRLNVGAVQALAADMSTEIAALEARIARLRGFDGPAAPAHRRSSARRARQRRQQRLLPGNVKGNISG